MKKFYEYFSFIIILLLSCNLPGNNKLSPPELKYAGTEPAFEFSKDQVWANVKQPLSLLDLRGKIVLLHFWKYTSINCIHTLAELKKLEKKWKKELVVIGVHSPKFTAEGNLESLKQSILRNKIEHPVVTDNDFTYLRQYGINSWPSFVLIDPHGMVFGVQVGEGVYEGFDKIISGMTEEFQRAGLMNLNPVEALKLLNSNISKSTLSFPGKLIVNDKGSQLFISDTNHNRILRVDRETKKILDIIGSGDTGFKDGKFTEAKFNHPQGLALNEDTLYIADSENHSIRQANLRTKIVKTIAGTGEQARTFNVSGRGRDVAFNSPWDLILNKNRLFITMRGSHQIWTLDLLTLDADAYAGSGSENLFDGKLQEAALAQPTGITKDTLRLYFADSETSSVRSIGLKASPIVKTIVGKGLLEFGDLDGLPGKSRFQFHLVIVY